MSIRSKIPTESKHGDKKTTVPLIEKTTTDRMKDLRQDWLLQHRKGPRTRNRQDDKGGLLKRHSFSHLTYSKARAEQFFLKLQTINVGLRRLLNLLMWMLGPLLITNPSPPLDIHARLTIAHHTPFTVIQCHSPMSLVQQ